MLEYKGKKPIICSICGQNEAVIFVKIVTENQTEEKGLCSKCAVDYLQNNHKIKELNFLDERLLSVIEEMKDLLAGIIANISAIGMVMNSKVNKKAVEKKNNPVCSNCGMTFEKFKETGMLGCPYCYQAFQEYIKEFIFELERGSVHRGSMPEKFARLYVLKKEILFLHNKLQKLLTNEDYEEAEKVKKKLEKLIGNYDSSRDDEIY